MTASEQSGVAERRRDRVIGLCIVAVAFVLSLLISLWAKHKSEPEQSAPLAPPSTERIAGWPNAVTPAQNLQRVREVTRRALFRGFVAIGVRSDGTVDLTKPDHEIRYAFQSPQGQGPQPPREPGVVPRRDLCGKQSVRIGHEGVVADPDEPEVSCIAVRGEPLPEPGCSLARVWERAIERGVSRHALARIDYYWARSGPAFRFELLDRGSRFALSGDCSRELSRSDATGHVP